MTNKLRIDMEMVAQKFESFQAVKDEEYRYWSSVSPAERIAAGHQMSVEGYRAYGFAADGRQLKTVAVRLQRPGRDLPDAPHFNVNPLDWSS